jgi:hAT family C-terminal dimerisation region
MKKRKRTELEDFLKSEIRKEVDHFVTYSTTTPLDVFLNEHPTESFKKELEQAAKDKEPAKVNKSSPSYAATRFDILHWWNTIGKGIYPKLAIGAPIILGKPAHNGYQERVFSIGKYCDNTLRNRMRPENFEMRVLDTVNQHNDGINKFTKMATTTYDSKFVRNFFTEPNLKLILKSPKNVNNNNQNDETINNDVDVEPQLDAQLVELEQEFNPTPQYADDDEEDADLDNPFAKST